MDIESNGVVLFETSGEAFGRLSWAPFICPHYRRDRRWLQSSGQAETHDASELPRSGLVQCEVILVSVLMMKPKQREAD